MKLEKLNFQEFEQNALSFSSLKSIVGGAEFTRMAGGTGGVKVEGESSKYVNDMIDDNGGTHFGCGDVYDDDICAGQ